MKKQKLSTEGQRRLFDLISRGFEIYNAFAPGHEGEKTLLRLRDDILKRKRSGDAPETPITLTVPLELAGYMMAAAKHLGDMCSAISKMGEEGVLFKDGAG